MPVSSFEHFNLLPCSFLACCTRNFHSQLAFVSYAGMLKVGFLHFNLLFSLRAACQILLLSISTCSPTISLHVALAISHSQLAFVNHAGMLEVWFLRFNLLLSLGAACLFLLLIISTCSPHDFLACQISNRTSNMPFYFKYFEIILSIVLEFSGRLAVS